MGGLWLPTVFILLLGHLKGRHVLLGNRGRPHRVVGASCLALPVGQALPLHSLVGVAILTVYGEMLFGWAPLGTPLVVVVIPVVLYVVIRPSGSFVLVHRLRPHGALA